MSVLKGKNGDWSSKRIVGIALLAYVLIVTSFAIFNEVDFEPNISGVINTMLISACGVLGISVFENKR